MHLFLSLKNEAKVKKNENEKNQLLIQAQYEFHFYIVGKLKDRRAQKYILLWGNFASYLHFLGQSSIGIFHNSRLISKTGGCI